MKSPTLPISNPFQRLRGWILSPESLRPGRWLLLVTAAVLMAAISFPSGSLPAYAQTSDGAITGLTLTSEERGTLTVTWDAPMPTPNGFWVNWSDESGGASSTYTTDTSHTFTELREGEMHRVKVRAQYGGRNGPWSEVERLVVTWQFAEIPSVTRVLNLRISRYGVATIGYAVNGLATDYNSDTLDLTLRADIVDARGKDSDSCEQQGMGEDNDLYIIDEYAEGFTLQYGSRIGDCLGEHTIIATVRDGSGRILKRVLDEFGVMGGRAACIGCGLQSMPTILGDPIVGQTLTADTSVLSIPPYWRDVQFTYQWI